MTDQIPAEIVPVIVKLWLDMQTGIKRGVLENARCACDLALDCPKCGRENKLIMYLYSGGAVSVECIGVAPLCGYYVRANVAELLPGGGA
jgi:hypothetical protein